MLLAFALKWRKETDVISAEQLREFEREIWLSHLHAAMEDGQDTVGKGERGGEGGVCRFYVSQYVFKRESLLSLGLF